MALVNFEHKANLSQVITKPTRSTVKLQSLIDLVFTSNIEMVSMSGIIPCNISDHDLVYIIFF